MTPRIQAGTLEDLPAIAALHRECFVHGWDLAFLGRILAQPGAFSVIAIERELPAGFVLGRANAGEAEILSLGVRPSSRRRRLGSELVRKALEHAASNGAAEAFLEVSVENAVAGALYGRLGFREVGRRRAYYREGPGPGTDARILKRSLPL